MRKLVLVGTLAVVAAALVFAPGEEKPSRPNRDSAEPVAARTANPPIVELKVPARASLGRPGGELFSSPPPLPPAVPVISAAPAPAPVAPPNPYRFAGKSRQGSQEQTFVSKSDSVIAVKEGDTLDGGYRVAAVTAAHIELVYPFGGLWPVVPFI